MSERGRPSLRPALLVVLLLLGLVEVQSVVQTVKAQTRLRERVIRTQEAAVIASWPEIARMLRPGTPDAWQRGLEDLMARSTTASEAELLDTEGGILLAHPTRAPVVHWPPPSRLQSILTGLIFTWGPVAGAQPRLLTYAAFPSGERTVVLRLSGPVPELVEDLRERRGLLVGHGLVLVLLAVAAGLVLTPVAPPPSAHGVEAYAEALGRMRDLGQALSEQHQVERDRLTGEMRDLEAMARAGELTAGIAHEVRNGLGTILGYARLIEQQSSPEAADPARRIREECETLEAVVRRFMAFVRRETLHPVPFDLRAMIRRVVARETAAHPVADVNVGGPEVRFLGDEELLERVFENVVRNACEAAGRSGHVRVEVETDAERLRVTVQDDGPGWPVGTDAFRPFASTKPGGLGLGLPLARKLARLHGGDVCVLPSERGARVEVSLGTVSIPPRRGET